MGSLEEVLERLNPPLKYVIREAHRGASFVLFDPGAGAMAHRAVTWAQVEDPLQFRTIILYAINELRLKGSQTPLDTLPDWE